ncbi:hypothetical protein GQ457_16G015140 [Hibiscus cannabinus]
MIFPVRGPNVDNQLIWVENKNRCFSVKLGYHLIMRSKKGDDAPSASNDPRNGKQLWKSIWSLKIPPKIRTFLWKKEGPMLITCMLWHLWISRNELVLSGSSTSPIEVWNKSKTLLDQLFKTGEGSDHRRNMGASSSRLVWNPPPQEWIKINGDASWECNTGLYGAATVLRDLNGSIVGGDSKKFSLVAVRLLLSRFGTNQKLCMINFLRLVRALIIKEIWVILLRLLFGIHRRQSGLKLTMMLLGSAILDYMGLLLSYEI